MLRVELCAVMIYIVMALDRLGFLSYMFFTEPPPPPLHIEGRGCEGDD